MEELLKKLKLSDGHDEEHDESPDHDHDHDRRRRRSLKIPGNLLQLQFQENELRSQRRYRRETTDNNHRNESKKYQKVLNLKYETVPLLKEGAFLIC